MRNLNNLYKELTINWHMLETCNYECGFCFAKYGKDDSTVYHKNIVKTEEMLNILWEYFHNNIMQTHGFKNLRLNFAGGEPTLLGNKLLNIIDIAKKIGFKTSIITNASKLGNQVFSTKLYNRLDMLGISIDSANDVTNRKIGRIDKHDKILSLQEITSYIQQARTINPNMKIKINTVVNEVNKNENFANIIKKIEPVKWKIFRVLPQIADFLMISDADFKAFLERHHAHQEIITSEDNDEMKNSYIMIDPKGRFYQNTKIKGHDYSQPILDVGCAEAFQQISFDLEKFIARYPEMLTEVSDV